MRLGLADYVVTQVEFGAKTTLQGTMLIVDGEEIRSLVLSDGRISEVDIHKHYEWSVFYEAIDGI